MMINSMSSIVERFKGTTLQGDVLLCSPAQLVEVMKYLRLEGFTFLVNLTAVERPDCYTMVYIVGAYEFPERFTIKVDVPKDKPFVATLTGVWLAANWTEREVYDMFGITFTDHPDLRRILTPDDFKGYPLRKDYHG